MNKEAKATKRMEKAEKENDAKKVKAEANKSQPYKFNPGKQWRYGTDVKSVEIDEDGLILVSDPPRVHKIHPDDFDPNFHKIWTKNFYDHYDVAAAENNDGVGRKRAADNSPESLALMVTMATIATAEYADDEADDKFRILKVGPRTLAAMATLRKRARLFKKLQEQEIKFPMVDLPADELQYEDLDSYWTRYRHEYEINNPGTGNCFENKTNEELASAAASSAANASAASGTQDAGALPPPPTLPPGDVSVGYDLASYDALLLKSEGEETGFEKQLTEMKKAATEEAEKTFLGEFNKRQEEAALKAERVQKRGGGQKAGR